MSIFSGRGSRSVISKRSTTLSSILKKKGNLKIQFNNLKPTSPKVRFELPHSGRVSKILQDFLDTKISKDYEHLICLIRDAELQEDDLLSLLKECTDCIPLLNEEFCLLIEALLAIKWHNRNENVVREYQTFVINLLCAHNYHARFVINKIVTLFLPDVDESPWPDGLPTATDTLYCSNVHSLFNVLLTVVPLCKEMFISALYNTFPYHLKPLHVHEFYLTNLLWILEYQPTFRQEIFHLIFSKLIILDVNAPKDEIIRLQEEEEDEDIFQMDLDCRPLAAKSKTVVSVSHTLDICLDIIYKYFQKECKFMENGDLDWDKTKSLYQDFLIVFDKVILPTYALHYVQFTVFLLCAFKQSITEAFVNHLWKKVCNPNVAAVIRQASISYIASLMARGTFVPLNMLKSTLKLMAEWVHSYISAQDGVECVNADVRIHSVFYSICQSLFYVMVFRHTELVTKKKNLVFLESLNVAKIITCHLNPLKVCQSAVVQKFAAMTRKFQLAYCYSVMEHNARNTMPVVYQSEKGALISCNNNVLNMVFPFDPYILKVSGKYIKPHYREYLEKYDNNVIINREETENGEVDDDFLYSQTSTYAKQFSYGSSPGFKFK